MHRIDTDTADPTANGAGKPGFRDGVAPGTAPTRLDAAAFNSYQEELCNPVEAAVFALKKGANSQLLRALQFADLVRAPHSAMLQTPVADKRLVNVDYNGNGDLFMCGSDGLLMRIVNDGSDVEAMTPGSAYSAAFRRIRVPRIGGYNADAIAVGAGEEIQTLSGTTWTRRNTGATALYGVACDNSGKVVVCGASGLIKSSVTPTTWTTRTSARGGAHNMDIAWGAGMWVIACDTGLQSSPDGETFTARASTRSYQTVKYVDGLGFIAISTTEWGLSANGIDWTFTSDLDINISIADALATRAGVCLLTIRGPLFYTISDGFAEGSIRRAGNVLFPVAFPDQRYATAFNFSPTVHWNSMIYSPWHRGIVLVGESGGVDSDAILGFHPTPFADAMTLEA